MVITDFSSKIVFLDTAPLIYFIEGNSQYQEILSKLFALNDTAGFSFITSSITLLEVLVKPIKDGKFEIAQQYRDMLTKASGIDILDVTTAIAEGAAKLRARHNLRTPDAIQLATSIESRSDYFLTNDMHMKSISSVKVITLGELQL
jgi:predicted nucleic acid-binding protein